MLDYNHQARPISAVRFASLLAPVPLQPVYVPRYDSTVDE